MKPTVKSQNRTKDVAHVIASTAGPRMKTHVVTHMAGEMR